MKLVTVVLVGEHALLRDLLHTWFSRFDNVQVVADAAGGKQAMDMMRRHKPTLVMMDFDTVEAANLKLLAKLRKNFPNIKVIVFFDHARTNLSLRLLRSGATGFVVKSARAENMERAIKTVISGGIYISPEFLKSFGMNSLLKWIPDKRGIMLSPRQAKLLMLMAIGLSRTTVAAEMQVSVKAVLAYKKVLMNRLGLRTTAMLVRHAIRSGLVPA